MGEVIDFPDYIYYGLQKGSKKIDHVRYQNGVDAPLSFFCDGNVSIGRFERNIGKKELSRLMIAWLAINNPDVLKFDD